MKIFPALAALVLFAAPAGSQELWQLDEGKSGHTTAPAPKKAPPPGAWDEKFEWESGVSRDEIPRLPGIVMPKTAPADAPQAAAKAAVEAEQKLKRLVEAIRSGGRIEEEDLSWAKGLVAAELARLEASGDPELKFRAELSCLAETKKGGKCVAAEAYQELLKAKKDAYLAIKALLDAQVACPLQGCQ